MSVEGSIDGSQNWQHDDVVNMNDVNLDQMGSMGSIAYLQSSVMQSSMSSGPCSNYYR